MNRETYNDGSEISSERDDALERLFKHTGPRLHPPEADEQAIRESLHAEWRAVVGRRKWQARTSWAAAAMIFVVGAVVLLDGGPRMVAGPQLVASISRMEGRIQIVEDGEVLAAELASGDAMFADQSVDTMGGAVAFDLPQGGSLRLATDSRIRFISGNEIELLRGALYFDSQNSPASGDAALTIRTPLGSVRDIGTQFMAELERETIGVSVREGSVAVEQGDGQFEAGVGERLRVSLGGGIAKQAIELYGNDWDWVEQLAPTFEIEGRSVFDFLTWVEHETGRHVVFTSVEAENRARRSVLRGTIDLQPMPMLRAVMATTDLTYTVSAGEIAVSTGI
jgi:ferric-dicitrate binding protein FerR (iron transport regulator)